MVKITKDMTIGEILNVDYDLASVLMGGGMYLSDARPLRQKRWRKRRWCTELTQSVCLRD